MITCKFEDGDNAELRHVAADGLIIRNNHVLLVKRAEFLSEGGKYCLPGGYMDRDERTKDAALREVLEETGWEGVAKELFAIVDNPNRGDDRQNISIVFLVDAVKEIKKPDHEVTDVRWFSLDELPPSEQIAFDHEKVILAYKEYQIKKTPLPYFL